VPPERSEKNKPAEFELLLVSESPRRRQILSDAGFLFRVDTVKISETIEENVNLGAAVVGVARDKAEAYLATHKHLKGLNILLLSADTMVFFGEKPLGKPKNSTEAQEFLRLLSGKTHRVITGIYIHNLKTGETLGQSDETEVQFRELSEAEITKYIQSGEPLDKAGAYAIQGEGGQFVTAVKGSRLNVVGFPLELFEKTLKEKSWYVARESKNPK